MDLIKVAEEAFATGKKFPEFRSGDTITVAYKQKVDEIMSPVMGVAACDSITNCLFIVCIINFNCKGINFLLISTEWRLFLCFNVT